MDLAVIESGIIFSGLPLVKVYYYSDKSSDSMLTAGLLEAIQSFAGEIFGDDPESFKMTKYSIYLQKQTLTDGQKILFYAICDSDDRPKSIMQCIQDISRKFKEKYSCVDIACLDEYKPFEEVITKCFGDLRYRPEDRLKKFFF